MLMPSRIFAKIEWIFFVALLITRVVKAHQNPLVWQIRFQHSRAGKGHPHRQRLLIHFKNRNILEFIAVFLSDINLRPGNRRSLDRCRKAPSDFWLRDRRDWNAVFPAPRGDLHIQPQANGGADESDKGK
jgi:hypothetical protein